MRRADAGLLSALVVVFTALSALAALPARAQSAERQGRFHVGPVWLTPKVVLHNAGVDDNVFNQEGQGVSDRQAVLTPSLDALLPVGRRLRLSSTLGLGFNYFQREESERSTDRNGSLRAELDAGPFTFFGQAAAGRHRQRFSVEIDERFERTSRSHGGGVLLRPSHRLTLTARANWQTQLHEDGVILVGQDVKAALDRESRVTSGELRYAITPRTSLVVSADVVDDTFTAQSGGPGEVRSYRYLGGFSFTGGLLSGGARAGLRQYPEDADQAVPAYDGLSLAVDVSLPVGRRSRLALLAGRDVSYAVSRGAAADGPRRNSFVSSSYGATFNTELPGSLVGRGSVTFQRADFVLPHLAPEGVRDRLDDVWTYGLALFRAFGPSLRVGGQVEWSRRESSLPGTAYRRRSYGLSAEYTP